VILVLDDWGSDDLTQSKTAPMANVSKVLETADNIRSTSKCRLQSTPVCEELIVWLLDKAVGEM